MFSRMLDIHDFSTSASAFFCVLEICSSAQLRCLGTSWSFQCLHLSFVGGPTLILPRQWDSTVLSIQPLCSGTVRSWKWLSAAGTIPSGMWLQGCCHPLLAGYPLGLRWFSSNACADGHSAKGSKEPLFRTAELFSLELFPLETWPRELHPPCPPQVPHCVSSPRETATLSLVSSPCTAAWKLAPGNARAYS